MCGVVGIVDQRDVNQGIVDALTTLQHRGQDAAGIATCQGMQFHIKKNNGLVRDALAADDLQHLPGRMGIGHVRYPTAGTSSSDEAQPFYVNAPHGIMLAHNGNLVNAQALSKELIEQDQRHLNTDSDSEILLNVFAHALQSLPKSTLNEEGIFKAVSEVHQRCCGAYAVVLMIAGFGIVAFRDPHGIRPLIYGKCETNKGRAMMVASESAALDVLGYSHVADVQPGEAIIIREDGRFSQKQCASHSQLSPCLFEYVYLARPDSVMDNISVYKVRLHLGDHLANKIKDTWGEHHDIDVVIPIPDTSQATASALARALGLKFREGFVRNRYIGRTFIMPGQNQRARSVRQKLNTIPLEFKDKHVLLVDDSIVRGTTSKEIIQMARDAGARKVSFASAAPKVQYPNVYGIDMPTANELVAHGRTTAQVCQLLGADHLIYQDLSALVAAAREGNAAIEQFDDSVFTGHYITGGVSDDYLQSLAKKRSDASKKKRDQLEPL